MYSVEITNNAARIRKLKLTGIFTRSGGINVLSGWSELTMHSEVEFRKLRQFN